MGTNAMHKAAAAGAVVPSYSMHASCKLRIALERTF